MTRVTAYVAAIVIAGALATAAVAQRTASTEYNGPQSRGPGATHVATGAAVYPPRWEYGRFRFSPLQADWSWRSGPEKVTGDASTIYRKLNGPDRGVITDIWYGEVVSVLGQQGWEVFLMRDYEQGSEVWFKRPAK